ncbi:hypothetical protein [Streptomyces afghaniensis]|uniref:hypothetical protein n=1 Tax=Streptomyces afghaniensis TaxID=66865 RepID=UPI00379006DC
MAGWQFRVDRGGTFTDIVARRPDGRLLTHNLLSDSPALLERRPSIFARRIELSELLYERVVEVDERIAADGTVTELGGSDSADVVTGDVLVIETPGGGGYGPPSPDPHQAGEEIDDLRAF